MTAEKTWCRSCLHHTSRIDGTCWRCGNDCVEPPTDAPLDTREQGTGWNSSTSTPRSSEAIYAGSFDPPTLGHEDIIRRSARVFDKLYVGIGTNSSKAPFLRVEERKFLLMAICKDMPNVQVVVFGGLLAEYCKSMGIGIMVRGLRATLDFESELSMAHVNRKLAPDVDTMFLVTETDNSFVSSSGVKEVLQYGGDISSFVSEGVEIYLKNRELIHS